MMWNKQTINKKQNKKNKMLPTFNLSSRKHLKRMGNPRTPQFWVVRGYKKRPWRWRRTLSRMGMRVSKTARRRFSKQQIHSIQLNPVYDLFWKARGFKKGRPINWRELLTATGYKKEVKYEKYELNDYFIKNSRETTPDPKSWIDITFPGMGEYSEELFHEQDEEEEEDSNEDDSSYDDEYANLPARYIPKEYIAWPNKKDLPRQNRSQDLLPEEVSDDDDLTDKDEYGNSPTSQQPMEYIGSPTGTNFVENKPFCSESHQLSNLHDGEHIATLSARDLPYQATYLEGSPTRTNFVENKPFCSEGQLSSLHSGEHIATLSARYLPYPATYLEGSPTGTNFVENKPFSSEGHQLSSLHSGEHIATLSARDLPYKATYLEEFLPEKSYHENNSSVYGGDNYFKEDSPDESNGYINYSKEESPHRWHNKDRSPESSSRKNRELLPEKNYYDSNLSPNGQDNYCKEDSSHRWYSRDPSPDLSSRKSRVYPDLPANREELLPQQKYEKYCKDGPLYRRHSKERSPDPPAWRRRGYPDRLSNREELRPKRDYSENRLSHIRNQKYRRDDPNHNRRPRSPHHSTSWKYRRSPDRRTYREELRSRRDDSLKHSREDSPIRYRRSRERSPLARDRRNSSRSFYNDRRFQD